MMPMTMSETTRVTHLAQRWVIQPANLAVHVILLG